MRTWTLLFVGLTSAVTAGCRIEFGPPGGQPVVADADEAPRGEVWVYTSMYQSVIDELTPQLKQVLPDVEVKWFQGGSEKVAQRVEAEWSAGGSKACLLMTSDPFWYAGLKEEGRLAPHFAPNVLQLDRSLVDPDATWVTSRISLMVMARNAERVSEADAPTRMDQLADPVWADRVSMGDPLSSGTNFTTVGFLQDEPGWAFLESLRDNGLIAAGGNSSVTTRIETGEREIGLVLLENLLKAAKKNSPATPIYPEDGSVVVPGPIALTSTCPNPAAARAVYDFILSEPGQRAIVGGNMYAALPGVAPPDGAPPLQDIPTRTWRPGFLDEVREERGAIKERWARLMAGE